MAIIQPKLVGIDSSVFAGWAADAFSLEACARDAARNALTSLLTSDWIPLLSWHHFEELACHAEEQVVANRMALLRSLSHIAWIKTSADPANPGSAVDLLAADVGAAAKRWVAAVNADGTYGTWVYAIAKKVADVATVLSQMGD